MKRYFLAGIAILLPFVITVIVVTFLVDLLTDPFVDGITYVLKDVIGNFTDASQHKTLLLVISRIIALIVLFALILLLGFLGTRFIFGYLLNKSQVLMSKIPIVKTIYRISRDVTSQFVNKDKTIFKNTVSVPFPYQGVRSVGFCTTKVPDVISDDENLHAVFVPTAPHPISGFLIAVDEKDINSLNWKTEDLFKFLISCGLYDPEQDKT